MVQKSVLLVLVAALCLSLTPAAVDAVDLHHVCIIIRTYYGHGTYGDSSLINLLQSLQKQTYPR
jgi:hypothetical protein